MLVGLEGLNLVHGPQMLPDGKTLLFTLAQGGGASGRRPLGPCPRHRAALETGERKTLIDGGADGRYVPTGHLVYVLGGTLFAVPFNLAKLEVTGGPVPIVEGVRRVAAASVGTAHFAFSDSGSLVYLPGPISWGQEELFLFDRKGGAEALKLPAASYGYPRVSPDGKRLAFETGDGKETSVSIYELSGASSVRRLTFGGNNRFPVWSADGQRVAFQSDRDGDRAVFWQSIDGGTAERLTKPEPGTSHVPESWSPTGEILLFNVAKDSATSLWTLSVRDRKAMPFGDVRSTSFPTDAVFSPDGRWVAYQAGEASRGRSDHVRSTVPARRHQASDSPGRAAALVSRRHGVVLYPGGGRIQGRHGDDAAELHVYESSGGPSRIRHCQSRRAAAIRHHARGSDRRRRLRGPEPERIAPRRRFKSC